MKALCAVVICGVMLAGCSTKAPPPPRGGNAGQMVAAAQVPATPVITQQMQQPDAPEGSSRQVMSEREVEHRPDGVIVIRERMAETQLGGSQDWAKIVREYTSAELLKGLLLALALGIGGVVAMARGWPIAGMALLAGALGSVALVWWAGLVMVGIALALWIGWTVCEAHFGKLPLKTLQPLVRS